MAFEFPQKVQDKMDSLTPRQFEYMIIYLDLPTREVEDRDARYKALKTSWACVYPTTKEAFDCLDEVIPAVVQKRDLPAFSELLVQFAAAREKEAAAAREKETPAPIEREQLQEVAGQHSQFHSCYMHQHAAKLCEMFERLNSIGKAPTQGLTS